MTEIKSESNYVTTTDMPALVENDGIRALGYMPDVQDPLLADASLQVILSSSVASCSDS